VFWCVHAFEPRRRVSGDRADRKTEEDRDTKRYRIPRRCASRVAALLDHRWRHQTLNIGSLTGLVSKLFKAFQQTDLLPVCVEHQLLRNIIGRIVIQLMPALDQRLVNV